MQRYNGLIDINNYPYDPVPSNEKYGKCNKFGQVDIVTGIINYDLASNCRLNDSKCGKFGSEYSEKTEAWYILYSW